jgi:hypothetical protein
VLDRATCLVLVANWPADFINARWAASWLSARSWESGASDSRGLPIPTCTKDKIDFGRFGRRVIEADFSGGT